MSALSPAARYEYYTELANSLPPPVDHTRENHERRLNTAIDAFNALRPGDAYEARLAVQIVLCGAHAADSLREAGVYREDYAKRTRSRAQAAGMMREERAAKRMLAQEQKVRLATEAVADTAEAQPTTASAPPPQAEPQAAPPPVQITAASLTVAPLDPAATQVAPSPSPEAIVKAEAFADDDRDAAQIRHDRGVMPQNEAYFRHLTLPTDPALHDAA